MVFTIYILKFGWVKKELKSRELAMEMKEDELLEPVSPIAQHMNSSVLSVSIIAVLEFEIAIDELKFMSFPNHLIRLNPLFTSIMVHSQPLYFNYPNIRLSTRYCVKL